LCSARFLNRLPRRRAIRLLGYGHATDSLSLAAKDVPQFSIARKAAEQAYKMASLQPQDIQAAEVHDCFSISEIVAYEILGFASSGKGAQLLESGATALAAVRDRFASGSPERAIPVNVGGGLLVMAILLVQLVSGRPWKPVPSSPSRLATDKFKALNVSSPSTWEAVSLPVW
jgi:acetyl-CoA C-acetyltransferase